MVLYSTLLHLPPFRFPGIEPRTVATGALAVRQSDALTTRLDLIRYTWLDLIRRLG